MSGKDSPHSGDQECLMRYPDKQAYESETEPDRVRYLPDKAQRRDRHRLCEDTEGTGVNAPATTRSPAMAQPPWASARPRSSSTTSTQIT